MSPLSKSLESAGDALITAALTLVTSAIITGFLFYKISNSDNATENIQDYKVIASVGAISTLIFIVALYKAGRCLQNCKYN